MFSELLSNSGEKIFLEAVDQFFDLKLQSEGDDSKFFPSEKASQIEFHETEIEASLENLNVKFCESLDDIENDKDSSTEVDSEESMSSDLSIKKTLFSTDIFTTNSILISKEKLRLKQYYIEQIELVNQIKAIFFQDKPSNDKHEINSDISNVYNNNDQKRYI